MNNGTMDDVGSGDRVMIIDDDPQVLRLLGAIVRAEGAHVVDLETNPRTALKRLVGQPIDVLFTDLHMSGCDGLEVIREARRIQPGISTVLITAFGTVSSSVDAFRLGAVDYITKPFRAGQVANAMGRAAANNVKMRSRPTEAKGRPFIAQTKNISIVAKSPAMKHVVELAKRNADLSTPMLVTGEVGTGKETVVRFIHALSKNASGPFVKVNCEAISESQIAEVLFGKETSTGDIQCGAIEQAASGLLFLHGAANLPGWMQVKLASVFQERRFERIGGKAPVEFRTRVVASASENPDPVVGTGGFVDDFYYSLNQTILEIPPLRQRREDIGPLIMLLLHDGSCRSSLKNGPRQFEFSEEAMAKLVQYDWPGNVYELENLVRRAMTFAADSHLSARKVAELLLPARLPAGAEMISVPFVGDLKLMERALVMEVIKRSHGNKSAAARRLGLHRKSLYRILEQVSEEPLI